MPQVPFYTLLKLQQNYGLLMFFLGGEKETSLMKRVNPKKILSPLPQKQPSRRIHATARLVHDDDTTVTDHTDQETQFSFSTKWTLLGRFIWMICDLQKFSVPKQVSDIYKTEKLRHSEFF